MAFKVIFTDVETGEEIETTAYRTSLWDALDYGEQLPKTPSRGQREDYAWAFFAARRAGILGRLGVDAGIGTEDAILAIADRFDVSFKEPDADPLAQQTDR